MSQQMPHMKLARPRGAAGARRRRWRWPSGLSLSAGSDADSAARRVRRRATPSVIESTEPAAYVVKRPDSLTLLVELRNVSVANAAERRRAPRSDRRRDARAGDRADDGQALARVRVALARPLEYAVRSARNMIRLELTRPRRAAATRRHAARCLSGPAKPDAATAPQAPVGRAGGDDPRSRAGQPHAGGHDGHAERQRPPDADRSDRGRGQAAPPGSRFSERLVEGARRDCVEGPLVKRVRVSHNSREPLVTRVVMEVADGATYHVERAGADGTAISRSCSNRRSRAGTTC